MAGGLLDRIPKSERKKVATLGVLVLVLTASLLWSFSGSSNSTPPPASPPRDPNRVRATDLAGGGSPSPDARAAEIDPEVLSVIPVADVSGTSLPIKRNPFAYPPPPLPKPPKPPKEKPPATIPIGQISPSSVVAGIPKGVTLSISGNQFPVDSQASFNGRPVRTEFVNASLLRVTLTTADIAGPGSAEIRIRSQSQPEKLWSDPRTFTMTPAPTPPFKYIGRIGEEAVLDFGTDRDGRKRVRVGDVVGVPAQWKVLAVRPDAIEVLDTRNEIRRTVTIAKKS